MMVLNAGEMYAKANRRQIAGSAEVSAVRGGCVQQWVKESGAKASGHTVAFRARLLFLLLNDAMADDQRSPARLIEI